jgi:ferredoxin-type protein NapH
VYKPYRQLIQATVFAVMFLVPFLNTLEIYWVTGTFYAINIGGLGIADPSVILQAIFSSGELTIPLMSAAIFPLFLALLLGRIWCGWMCPYHLLADACSWIRAKASRKSEPMPLIVAEAFKANLCRFGFLVIGTAAAGAIGIPVLNYVNAPGIVSTEAMILVKERFVSVECAFIIVLLALELWVAPRVWCRLFCPTGSVISLFRLPMTLGVASRAKNPKAPCCKENVCTSVCPMGLTPYSEAHDLLCTNCCRCIDACPSHRLNLTGFRQAK